MWEFSQQNVSLLMKTCARAEHYHLVLALNRCSDFILVGIGRRAAHQCSREEHNISLADCLSAPGLSKGMLLGTQHQGLGNLSTRVRKRDGLLNPKD